MHSFNILLFISSHTSSVLLFLDSCFVSCNVPQKNEKERNGQLKLQNESRKYRTPQKTPTTKFNYMDFTPLKKTSCHNCSSHLLVISLYSPNQLYVLNRTPINFDISFTSRLPQTRNSMINHLFKMCNIQLLKKPFQ